VLLLWQSLETLEGVILMHEAVGELLGMLGGPSGRGMLTGVFSGPKPF
jgi:hypothetical protein